MESTAALEKVSNPPTEIVQPVNSEASSSTQPLSKKARKRLAKAAWIAEQKKGRRAAEKERRREKKRLLAEKRAAGELEEGYEGEQSGSNKKRRVEEFKGPKKPFGARVVVDLGFDNMMSENEIKSLTSQLAFTYSANRRAVHPFSSILFTSLNGRTLTRMDSINNAAYKRWVDTVWWQEGYERLWEGAKEAEVKDVKGGDGIMASAEETEQKEGKSENQSGRAGEVREPHVANRERR
ncbi:hypothetical protein AcW1_005049 [Taiwanofungus camphoratus]|nr:hypothetical protein AcW2_005942 [Antrodia cinnamomea]KAI0960569.1 hypothetical protein AcW1_005049 [Antrodia cinnamomea]